MLVLIRPYPCLLTKSVKVSSFNGSNFEFQSSPSASAAAPTMPPLMFTACPFAPSGIMVGDFADVAASGVAAASVAALSAVSVAALSAVTVAPATPVGTVTSALASATRVILYFAMLAAILACSLRGTKA